MSQLAWNDSYSVGVKAMDEQHQRLVALLNQLDCAMAEGKGRDALDKIFNDLVVYTQTHFKAEEALMAHHGYPDLDEHRQKHTAMTDQVLKLKQEAEDTKVGVTLKLMNFLTAWLTKHIAGTDALYGKYLNGKGIN